MLERSGYPAPPSVSGFLPCGDPGGRPCHMRPPQSEHSPVSRTETDTSAVHTSLTLCYSVVVSEAVKDSIARWVFFSHWSFHNCLSWKKKKKVRETNSQLQSQEARGRWGVNKPSLYFFLLIFIQLPRDLHSHRKQNTTNNRQCQPPSHPIHFGTG